MDDGDHLWVMAARPSPKGGLHHPLITRFHPTIGPHDPHSLRWTFPSELSLGVYHAVTILWLGYVKAGPTIHRAPRKG